jgi:hypothetical protein
LLTKKDERTLNDNRILFLMIVPLRRNEFVTAIINTDHIIVTQSKTKGSTQGQLHGG